LSNLLKNTPEMKKIITTLIVGLINDLVV